MNLVESSTLTNQSIASTLLVHTHTAARSYMVMVRVFIDQLSANTGSRQVWLGLKRGGVGSEYRVHLITQSASIVSAVTSIFSYYGPLPVADTDVLKVYVIGVAGDTTTTDIITEIWEENYTLDTVWTSTKAGYVDAPISTVDTVVDAIKTKTDNLPTDPADESLLEAAITAATSPLATAAALAVVDDFLDTEIAAIKAKTDNLPTDPADESLLEAAITAATSPLATAAALAVVDDFLDTEIAAIKAKTDNLPTDPADQSLLEAAIAAIPSAPTAAVVADAVWDEVLSGHVTTGTTGKKLTDLSSSGGGGSTAEEIDTLLSSTHGSGAWGSGGVGAVSHTITVNSGGSPLDGVDVWVTTDVSGSNVAARGTTNAFGQVTFFLDTGTYYGWKQLNGYSFTNPTEFTVA